MIQLAPPPQPREPKLENGYYVFDDVPVFDEHVGRDGVHYDARLLSAIANNQNRRIIDTGDYTPVVAWHTREDGDQSRQPPLVGYAANFHVRPLGNVKPRPCIYARFYVLPDQLETFRRNPRRSVELWPEKDPERRFFDPIALQGADTPQRDLGLIYTRGGSPERYRMYGHAIRYAIEGGELRIPWIPRASQDFPSPDRYARKKDDGGRWITIGGDKSAPAGEKGGTPVYIGESGRIEKGPDKLEGATLDDLKKPKAPSAKKDFPDATKREEKPEAKQEPGPRSPRDGAGGAGSGDADSGSNGRNAGRARKIVKAREKLTPKADISLVPEGLRKHLSEDQQEGVGAAINAMDKHGGFLLADGTGVGKTRQMLAVADKYAKEGKKVLIVSKAEAIKPNWKKGELSGSFASDGEAMGVDVSLHGGADPLESGKVSITTYERLSAIKGKIDNDTVLIWDESHSLKNWGSARSKHGFEMSKAADKVMYATATPADKPLHIAHLFRAGVFGKYRKWEETYQKLGMKQVEQWTGREYIKKWEIDPQVGAKGVYKRMSALFDQMTKEGLMIKREVSFDGVEVQVDDITLSDEAKESLSKIFEAVEGGTVDEGRISDLYDKVSEYNQTIKNILSDARQQEYDNDGIRANFVRGGLTGKAKANYESAVAGKNAALSEIESLKAIKKAGPGLRRALALMQARRQQEPYKIDAVKKAVDEEIAAGRSVVVFASRVNKSEVKDSKGETVAESEGTTGQLVKQLEAAGYSVGQIHGGVSKAKQKKAMDAFQAGKTQVIVATVESGGTGINLDDTVGDKPRTMVMMTPPFSAVENVQAAGRVNRMTTKSDAKLRYIFADTAVDRWNASLVTGKMKTLGAAVKGSASSIDIGGKGDAAGFSDVDGMEESSVEWHSLTKSPRDEKGESGGGSASAPKTPSSLPSAVSSLGNWSEPRKVNTKNGTKFVRKASPGKAFWDAWKANKARLKDMGVSVSKYNGEWEVSYWSDKYRKDFPAIDPSLVDRYARKKKDEGGRWITIGGDKSAPAGEKGGTPVYIGESGRIEKGPDKLEGASLDDLKKPKAPSAKKDFPEPKAKDEPKPKAEKSAAERIQAFLDADDHERAFEEFSRLKKAEVDSTAREVFGVGFYNQTKKQMLEVLKKNMHRATKSAVAEQERREEENLLRKDLKDAQDGMRAYEAGRGNVRVRGFENLTEDQWRNPHAEENKAAVQAAWSAVVAEKQRALDEFLGNAPKTPKTPSAKKDFPEPKASGKDPTPNEIAQRAAEVRSGWDEKTREERKVGGSNPAETKSQILDAYKRLSVRSEYQDGLIDLPRMLAKAQLSNPGLTKQEFHESIMDLAKETGLQLRFANEPSNIQDAEEGLWYSPNENRVVDIKNEKNPPWDAGLYHYAYIHPDRLREVMRGGGRR